MVGLSSLHYFWTARTPEATAADIEHILRHYLAAWHKDKVILCGYSFGADILPFVVTRLPDDLRQRLGLVVFLGLGSEAAFEFHLASWLGRSDPGAYPVAPELARLRGLPMLCFYGTEDADALCRSADPTLVEAHSVPGGHRIGHEYGPVADAILRALSPQGPGGVTAQNPKMSDTPTSVMRP